MRVVEVRSFFGTLLRHRPKGHKSTTHCSELRDLHTTFGYKGMIFKTLQGKTDSLPILHAT